MKWPHWVLVVALISVFGLLAVPGAAQPVQRFNDVDQSNIFFADIDWMADSGVTSGCSSNPPLFCPDDFVTREQMAAFMHRLATKRVVDADELDGKDSSQFIAVGQKVSDADKLDGKDSSAFLQVGQAVANADKVDGKHANQLGSRGSYGAVDDAPEDAFAATATVTAPSNGLLISSGTVDITASGGADTVVCGLWLVEAEIYLPGSVMFASVDSAAPGSMEGICSSTGAVFVPAGTWTVALAASRTTAMLYQANVWVQWIPFDGEGATPTAVAPTGTAANAVGGK